MRDKILELRERTINILERTKKDIEKYGEQRKQLYKYYKEDALANLEEWENFLNKFEKKVEKES